MHSLMYGTSSIALTAMEFLRGDNKLRRQLWEFLATTSCAWHRLYKGASSQLSTYYTRVCRSLTRCVAVAADLGSVSLLVRPGSKAILTFVQIWF